MAKEAESDTPAQLTDVAATISHTSQGTAGPRNLRPVSVPLPGEILSAIAEACGGPYCIEIEQDFPNASGFSLGFNVICDRAFEDLVCVSGDFKAGIQRGLRIQFNGHLSVPGRFADQVSGLLAQRNLEWVIPKVTLITVIFNSPPYRPPITVRSPYHMYTNLKDFNIIFVDLRLRSWHGDYRQNPTVFDHTMEAICSLWADPFIKQAQSSSSIKTGIVCKLIANMSNTFMMVERYRNLEMQFLGAEEKVLDQSHRQT